MSWGHSMDAGTLMVIVFFSILLVLYWWSVNYIVDGKDKNIIKLCYLYQVLYYITLVVFIYH